MSQKFRPGVGPNVDTSRTPIFLPGGSRAVTVSGGRPERDAEVLVDVPAALNYVFDARSSLWVPMVQPELAIGDVLNQILTELKLLNLIVKEGLNVQTDLREFRDDPELTNSIS